MQAALIPTDSQDEFIRVAATVLERAIVLAVEQRNRCILGLSGGSTPGPVYELLGQKRTVDWGKVHLFLADERCVPTNDDNSNQKLITNTLLKHAAIPDLQRHFPDVSLPPGECARSYDHTLRTLMPDDGPDVVVLGMGNDGHVASLFPPLSAADLHAAEYAVATTVPLGPNGTLRFPIRDRISASLTLLRMAETKVFLLNGAMKKTPWHETSLPGADALQWPGALLLHHAVAVTRW